MTSQDSYLEAARGQKGKKEAEKLSQLLKEVLWLHLVAASKQTST